MKKLLIFTAIALFLSGCSGGFCPKDDIDQALQQVEDINDEWFDALAVADSTSRIALSGPVGDLQALEREVKNIDMPPCGVEMQKDLLKHMGFVIDGFLAFMADENEGHVQGMFSNANTYMKRFTEEYSALNQCLPNCTEAKLDDLR